MSTSALHSILIKSKNRGNVGGDHGFIMGDGPMESSPAGRYFEFEIIEKFANVVGMKGGILCGYSASSPEVVTTHITGVVLDGVVVGGVGQAVTRAAPLAHGG